MGSASCKLNIFNSLSGLNEARLISSIILLNFTYSIPLVIFEYTKQSDYRERDYQ